VSKNNKDLNEHIKHVQGEFSSTKWRYGCRKEHVTLADRQSNEVRGVLFLSPKVTTSSEPPRARPEVRSMLDLSM
jgi:hypothetical protein